MRSAADIMSSDVVTVDPACSIGAAIRLLAELRIRHLPVIDRTGVLVGIVSDGDLTERTADDQTPVADVMTRDVVTASSDDDLARVAEIMADLSLTAIPVVDANGKLTGIISYTDLLREQARIEVLEPPPAFVPPARPYPADHGGSPLGHALPRRRG